jgi:phosphoadenylyl-sulfate reductase (thioredoxin)
MTLGDKIDESYNILRYAINNYEESLAITFSGGKDSLVVLHMTRTLCDDTVTLPVFSIDTGIKFPETMQFRDKIASLWNLNLIVLKNPEAAKIIGTVKDKRTCCQNLKIQPLKAAISEYKIQGLITAIRWDEQEARTMEEPLSPRENPPHMRIHPILHFTEADIWDYIHAFDLPYCELYDQGYRSLSCIPCTAKGERAGNEREGRSAEKEEIMNDLRLLGYF